MDREGFRNRLKQYKEARGLNPLLKYWEWKAQPAEKDIPRYLDGVDQIGKKEILWFKDWYNKRVEYAIANNRPDIIKQLEAILYDFYPKQYKYSLDLPWDNSVYTGVLDPKINDTKISINDQAIRDYEKKHGVKIGGYQHPSEGIVLPSNYSSSDLLHELAHTFNQVGSITNAVNSAISDENGFITIPAGLQNSEYWISPWEVHSRLMEFRKENNIDPTKAYNEEDIKQLRKSAKDKRLFEIFDDSQMMHLLNDVADNTTVSADDRLFLKNGGVVPKYVGGGEVKDNTYVAPIEKEQVFIPATSVTKFMLEYRKRTPGGGNLEIVSPEFDLLTLGRGLFTNTIVPKGKIGKLPIDENKYYREISDLFYGKSKTFGAVNDIENSGVIRTKNSAFKSPMFSKGKVYANRERLKDSYYIVSNDKKGLTWSPVDNLGVPDKNPNAIAFTPLYKGKPNVAPKNYFDIYKYLQDDLYLQIIPNHKVIPITGLNTLSENTESFAEGGEVGDNTFMGQFGNQVSYKPEETGWWSDVKNWWNDLAGMRNYAHGNCATTPDGKHTTQCAHYSNAILRNQGYKNIVGDAWTRAAHSGMKKITSGYDGLTKPAKWDEDDAHEYLLAAAENFANKADTTALNSYDVIGLYYPDSPNTKKAFEQGKWGETQTHTGHIAVGKDGTHYVVHNVDGHLKINKLADMLTGEYEYKPVSAYRPRK